jgi:4-hydroxy-tetrahydrodipicolinate synthase
LLKLAKGYFPGLILFQAGCDNLLSTLEVIRKAEHLGADTIICLPPYYFKDAPEAGLVKYFNAISRYCTVPLILYNFPLHTGNSITHGILEKVDHFGLKDSSGNLDLINKTQCYLTGGDSLLIKSYKKGASGFICSMSNVVPDLYVKLEHGLDNNDYDESLNILTEIKKLKESIPEKGITLIKKLLSERISGYPPHVRPPLIS